jgi:hypothetical protein
MRLVRFRDRVATEFQRRRALEPRYSLRRFARGLGVHHGTLSRMMRGTRPIPSRTLTVIAAKLHIGPGTIAEFVAREDQAAIVEAIGRPSFRPDSRWLASIAGISVDRVNIALQTLLRLCVLRMRSSERWELVKGVIE